MPLCVAGGGFLWAVQLVYELLGLHGQYGLHESSGRGADARGRDCGCIVLGSVRTGRLNCLSGPVGRRLVCRFAGQCGSCAAVCSSSTLCRCVDLLGTAVGAGYGL